MDCCKDPLHTQICYNNDKGESVESLVGVSREVDREFLHRLLDEYLDKRVEGKPGADYFIVFFKFPEKME